MARTSHHTLMENVESPSDWKNINNHDMELLKRLIAEKGEAK